MMGAEFRRFGTPTLLSLGLHGLVVAGLVVFPNGAPVAPAPLPILTVEMVEALQADPAAPSSAPAAVRQAVKSKDRLKSRPVAVKRVKYVSPVRAVKVAAPAAVRLALVVPAPYSPAPEVAARSEAADRPSAFAPLESANLVPMDLSAAGAAAPVSRPLPSAEGASRMLRDTISEGDSGRTKVRMGNNPRPEYPRLAREAGWEGTVVLLVEVMPDGRAGTVALHKSSGHPVLDEAAVTAVQEWRFLPAKDGNFPIMSVVQLPVRFDLKAALAN